MYLENRCSRGRVEYKKKKPFFNRDGARTCKCTDIRIAWFVGRLDRFQCPGFIRALTCVCFSLLNGPKIGLQSLRSSVYYILSLFFFCFRFDVVYRVFLRVLRFFVTRTVTVAFGGGTVARCFFFLSFNRLIHYTHIKIYYRCRFSDRLRILFFSM